MGGSCGNGTTFGSANSNGPNYMPKSYVASDGTIAPPGFTFPAAPQRDSVQTMLDCDADSWKSSRCRR